MESGKLGKMIWDGFGMNNFLVAQRLILIIGLLGAKGETKLLSPWNSFLIEKKKINVFLKSRITKIAMNKIIQNLLFWVWRDYNNNSPGIIVAL